MAVRVSLTSLGQLFTVHCSLFTVQYVHSTNPLICLHCLTLPCLTLPHLPHSPHPASLAMPLVLHS
ncbi:hypothetical protein E2C01_047693 [Portunus trituberculatus]|uniref:Uncharacterized protein n=1 Tax=Portunus trituberculatus TaxID=210409 RepID=A0A5B7G983_PORTR|nr:hypothetical protein [Portunus trituberculatus]